MVRERWEELLQAMARQRLQVMGLKEKRQRVLVAIQGRLPVLALLAATVERLV